MKVNNIELVKRLQNEINSIEDDLKLYPYDAHFYFVKAKKLSSLGNLTGNHSYYNEALESCDDAIYYSPEKNKLYLCERSMMLVALGKFGLAFLDVLEAKQVISKDKWVDGYFMSGREYYCNEVIERVLSVKPVKMAVKKLVIDGKVSLNDLIKYFPDMYIEITENVRTSSASEYYKLPPATPLYFEEAVEEEGCFLTNNPMLSSVIQDGQSHEDTYEAKYMDLLGAGIPYILSAL